MPLEVKDQVRDKWEEYREHFKKKIAHTIDFDEYAKTSIRGRGKVKTGDLFWAIDKMNHLIDSNIKFMYDEDWFTEENNRKFWEYNTKLDGIRGENMETQLPELYQAMKKYKV